MTIAAVIHTVTLVLGAYILRASSVSETFRRPWPGIARLILHKANYRKNSIMIRTIFIIIASVKVGGAYYTCELIRLPVSQK